MKGLKYQLKSIRRDKMCILTFLLPVIVGISINLLSGVSFQSIGETTFGIVENNITDDAVKWLQSNGAVIPYETRAELEAAVNDPSTQTIGVLQAGNEIQTFIAGDELEVNKVIADTLPQVYENRTTQLSITRTVIPVVSDNDGLKSLLIVITLVTAMFMGCTFNAMNIISEKEDGRIYQSGTSYVYDFLHHSENPFGFYWWNNFDHHNNIDLYENTSGTDIAVSVDCFALNLYFCLNRAIHWLLCKRIDGRDCLHQNCNDSVPCTAYFLLFDGSKQQFCFSTFVFVTIQRYFLWNHGFIAGPDRGNHSCAFGTTYSCSFLEYCI